MAPVREVVVLGCSAGGLSALRAVLAPLPANLGLSVLVVAHAASDDEYLLPELLDRWCQLPVCEARDKQLIGRNQVYVAPPGYHLLAESHGALALSIDPPVCYARPSIDVLFESAADAYGARLVAAILTGANHDGSAGIRHVHARGGCTLSQDPATAAAKTMPRAAIATGACDAVLDLAGIAARLQSMGEMRG